MPVQARRRARISRSKQHADVRAAAVGAHGKASRGCVGACALCNRSCHLRMPVFARDPFLATCESTAGPSSLAAIAFTNPADAARFSAVQAACQALPTRDLCLAPQLGYAGTAFSTVSGSTAFSHAASAGIAHDSGAADDTNMTAFLRGFRELLGAFMPLVPHPAC